MTIVNPGFGCLNFDPARRNERVRFYPGHYMGSIKPEGGNVIDSLSTILSTDLPACSAYRGMQERVNWKYLEPSEGVYDFSFIHTRLTQLQLSGADVRKLCILLAQRTFTNNHCVPDYMLIDPIYEGGDIIHSGVGNGYMIKWQNPYVVEKFRLMVNAMAASLNTEGLALRDNPQLAMLAISETAAGSAAINHPVHYAGLGQAQAHLVQAFPQTLVRQITNYPGPYLDTIFTNIAASGITAVGGPDSFDNEPGLESNQGYPGIYPRLRTNKDNYVIAMEVQGKNYINSAHNGSGYAPTVQQLLDFNKDTANWIAHIIVWTRSTATGNSGTAFADYINVQNLLNEVAQTADPFGGLRKTRPLLIT